MTGKRGRPSIYTEALADELFARLAGGESLARICKADHMPSVQTVFEWMRTREGFSERYARAKEECADFLAEEILDIADDSTNDWIEKERKDGSTYEAVNGEAIQRSRLRVDTRKWIASKLKPKKYGDATRHELSGPDGGAIEITDKNQFASKLAALAFKLEQRVIEGEYEDITDQVLIEHDDLL